METTQHENDLVVVKIINDKKEQEIFFTIFYSYNDNLQFLSFCNSIEDAVYIISNHEDALDKTTYYVQQFDHSNQYKTVSIYDLRRPRT